MSLTAVYNLQPSIKNVARSEHTTLIDKKVQKKEAEVLFHKLGKKWFAFSTSGDVYFVDVTE